MRTLTKETSEMLIRESKEQLKLYHVNLRKYDVEIIQDENDATATVFFTSKITGNIIYVECYYNEKEVLQTGIYL